MRRPPLPRLTYGVLVLTGLPVRLYKDRRAGRTCGRCGRTIPPGLWYTRRALPGNRHNIQPACPLCCPFDALRSISAEHDAAARPWGRWRP